MESQRSSKSRSTVYSLSVSGGRIDLGRAAGHADRLKETCLQFRIC